EIQSFDELKGLRIIETQPARLARHRNSVDARHVNGGLRVFKAGDRAHALPRVHDLDGVDAEGRAHEVAAFAVPALMVHASIDIGQRDAGSQRQYRRLVDLLRLWRVLRASLAEDERRKPCSHDHGSHSASSDAPKVAGASRQVQPSFVSGGTAAIGLSRPAGAAPASRPRLTGAIEAVGVSGAL